MKISNIRTFKFQFERSSWLLLAVETDSGIVGWGDMSDGCLCDTIAMIVEKQRDAWIGKEPRCIRECEEIISKWKRPMRSTVRAFSIIQSAMDQALWDITAKAYGIPLYKLYGADGNDIVPLYANLNNAIRTERTPKDLYRQGLLAKKAGFKIVKCAPFDEVDPQNHVCELDRGVERIRALTEIYPIEQIAVDCHQRFERHHLACMVERMLAEFGNPYWIEDPVSARDQNTVETLAVRYPQIRWASGEDAFESGDLMQIACTDCYDIMMPDVKVVGGPGTVRGMVDAIRGLGKTMTLHNPSGIIATAHSAHLSALCRGLPMEFPVGAVRGREMLTVPEEPIQNGMYYLQDIPGIGIEIRKDAFEEFAFEWISSKWIKIKTMV